ncbi:TPA: hypothetical protein DCL89_00285 [candidate division WWE3 bacterium]|uniref:Uncharacterized protein n=1 Tax=candidate division WWE3 bacterium TaxID=2053526 RepID=A0A354G445_UNCKA|nr:hypothetical protein [candidate division WWE3 bacterium]HBI35783.1 hypothetical protein [candidate division WWE3 bacterium]
MFKKRPKLPKVERKLLPEIIRKIPTETMLEKSSARNLLGIKARPGDHKEAIVKSIYKDTISRAIAYHKSPSLYNGVPVKLREALEYADDFMFLERAVRGDPGAYLNHIEREKSVSNEARTQFLTSVQEWALPRKNQVLTGHDVLIWGPAEVVIPVEHEPTIALDGEIVKYRQLGNVIRSVIDGNVMDMSETPADLLSGSVDPVWYAAPSSIVWHDTYYEMPHNKKAYAFWAGVITADDIYQIIELGDLLVHAEKVAVNDRDAVLFMTAVLRAEVDVNGKPPDFSNVAKIISKQKGKWELRTGSDVRSAFLAFIPGSSPPPRWCLHSVSNLVEVLPKFTDSLKSFGDRNGNYVAGFNKGQVVFLDNRVRPSVAYIGSSKTGKTTKALQEVFEVTQNVIWLPLSATQFEAVPKICKNFGGTVLPLNLPDAYTVMPNVEAPDRTKVWMAKQQEMHTADIDLATQIVRDQFSRWEDKKKIDGLPLTFEIESGNTVRLLNFYFQYLTVFQQYWTEWFKKTGNTIMLVADNFGAVQKGTDDPNLGYIPSATGRALGLQLVSLVNNGRNGGVMTRILTQNNTDLEYIKPGFIKDFGLVMEFEHNQYSIAKLSENSAPYVPELKVTLPNSILKLVGRQEPEQGADGWTQETSSAPS